MISQTIGVQPRREGKGSPAARTISTDLQFTSHKCLPLSLLLYSLAVPELFRNDRDKRHLEEPTIYISQKKRRKVLSTLSAGTNAPLFVPPPLSLWVLDLTKAVETEFYCKDEKKVLEQLGKLKLDQIRQEDHPAVIEMLCHLLAWTGYDSCQVSAASLLVELAEGPHAGMIISHRMQPMGIMTEWLKHPTSKVRELAAKFFCNIFKHPRVTREYGEYLLKSKDKGCFSLIDGL